METLDVQRCLRGTGSGVELSVKAGDSRVQGSAEGHAADHSRPDGKENQHLERVRISQTIGTVADTKGRIVNT